MANAGVGLLGHLVAVRLGALGDPRAGAHRPAPDDAHGGHDAANPAYAACASPWLRSPGRTGRHLRMRVAWVQNVGDPDAGQRPVFLKAGGTDGFNSERIINPGKDLVVCVAVRKLRIPIARIGMALSRRLP